MRSGSTKALLGAAGGRDPRVPERYRQLDLLMQVMERAAKNALDARGTNQRNRLIAQLTKKVDTLALVQEVCMSLQQKLAVKDALKALYLDYEGLKAVAYGKAAGAQGGSAVLTEYPARACQHLSGFMDGHQAYFLVNSPSNNIDVFKLVAPGSSAGGSQYVQAIDIQKGGYACSTVKGQRMYIGCRDGTLYELNCKTLKLERVRQNYLPI